MRNDRIFNLKELASYPGSETLDMTFFLPQTGRIPRRVWLMIPTQAKAPVIYINDVQLLPQRVVKDSSQQWVDMGVTEKIPGGFSQLRIIGMTPNQARVSFLVVTSQINLQINGKIEEVERKLWGISRREAGSTTIFPSRVVVGEAVLFTVRYSAGSNGLPPGSRVRFYIPRAFSQPQTEHLDEDGAVWCESSSVEIESIVNSEESHEGIDVICYLNKGLPPYGSFTLKYRTSTTYLFPCCFYETDRRYWYSKLPVLSAAVAIDDRKIFVSLAEGSGHIVKFVAGPAERLHLFLPGRRRGGKGLRLRGTFTDRYRNTPPSGQIPRDIKLFLLRDDNKRIDLGTPAGCFKDGHRFEVQLPDLEPGVYRAVALNNNSKIIATSNPLEVLPLDSKEPEIYWGEIHAHTEMSDGSGGFSELYRHARDEGCLDFAAASDHACYFSDNEWLWMQDVTNAWNEPGKFVTLVGYEWAGREVHRNIYTYKNRLKLFRGMYPPTSSIRTVWEYFKGDKSIVGGPHATMAHGIIWKYHEPSVERFVEIYSMWGASDTPDNPLATIARSSTSTSVNELLKTGALLGFTGGGDCHEGHCGFSCEDPEHQGKVPHTFAPKLRFRCGMTAALMNRLDRQSLINALRERKTYATTGARILLSFSISGIAMGDLGTTKAPIIKIVVHGCSPIKQVEIIKDGEVVFCKEENKLDVSIEWKDPELPKRRHFYYLRVVQTDGQMAWSSPIWIDAAKD